jgi:hypothetical protein
MQSKEAENGSILPFSKITPFVPLRLLWLLLLRGLLLLLLLGLLRTCCICCANNEYRR